MDEGAGNIVKSYKQKPVVVRTDLRRVVDQHVYAREAGEQIITEALDEADIGELDGAHDLEPVAPIAKVGLARIALHRVGGVARSSEDKSAGSEELEHDLVANPHAPACHHAHHAGAVGRLLALAPVVVAAARAELVVKVVLGSAVLL